MNLYSFYYIDMDKVIEYIKIANHIYDLIFINKSIMNI